MAFKMVIPGRTWFRRALLSALLGLTSAAWTSLHAGEPFSAYVDSDGRVVFTNETSPASSSHHASTQFPGSGPSPNAQIHELIDGIAEQHRVDPELIRAVVQVESNFDPSAVSPKGAMGLMQLIPGTARRFGVRNAFDPRANLDGGVRYLKYLLDLFDGDLRLALAAYNAGENAVSRTGGIPAFSETRNYLRKISLLYPLDRPPRRLFSTVERFVDSKGIVHFSNTELP